MLAKDQLEALAAAIAEGTFEAAAATLHVTPSAVSQRIKALETAVGRVLVVRSRPVQPTLSGRVLLRAARQIEAATADALRELGQDGSSADTVSLAVNADSLATWLVPALAEVTTPIAFDLRRADEGRTAELLREGSAMAAVTASREAVPGCTSAPLGRMRYLPLATPGFAARWFAAGPTAAALAAAPHVAYDRIEELGDRWMRRHTRRRLTPPRHYVPGSNASVLAVREGLGWGLIPELHAGQAGELVEIEPEAHIDVGLYWQQWSLRSAGLDEVAAAVRRHARAALR